MRAPTIAWVPDTGIFRKVAQNCHITDPIIADIIPIINSTLLPSNTWTSKMFFRMVSPTFAPSKTAPELYKDLKFIEQEFIIHIFIWTIFLPIFFSFYDFLSSFYALFLSNIVAKIQAVLIEIVSAPTVVPNEFATSFAPTAKARKNAIMNEIITYIPELKYKKLAIWLGFFIEWAQAVIGLFRPPRLVDKKLYLGLLKWWDFEISEHFSWSLKNSEQNVLFNFFITNIDFQCCKTDKT